jgi:hypothetical protein
MWKALGTKLLMTAAYHPQADGLAVRKYQTVEIAMRFYIFEPSDASWLEVIPALQWNLNSNRHIHHRVFAPLREKRTSQ